MKNIILQKLSARISAFLALLIFLSHPLFGQSNQNSKSPCLDEYPREEVVLFSDRDYYLTGDSLWFKAFVFLDGQLSSDMSKVLYLELHDHQKDVFSQKKYRMEEGMVDDLFEIPADIPSGNYFLRVYTQYGRNFGIENFFTKVVSIINPLAETNLVQGDKKSLNDMDQSIELTHMDAAIHLDINLSKDTFYQREKIELKINDRINANLLVSVRKKGSSHSWKALNGFITGNSWLASSYLKTGMGKQIMTAFPSEKVYFEKLKWIPEIKGLTLSGKVINSLNGEAAEDIYCIGSVIDDMPQLYLSKTNQEGAFIFSLPYLEDEKDIFVGMRYVHDQPVEILIDREFSTSFPKLQNIPFPYDSLKHIFLEEVFVNKQLNSKFQNFSKEAAYPLSNKLPSSFNIGKADFRVDINEFIYIPTVIEIFRELIPTVSVMGRTGNRKLKIYDQAKFRYFENTLVLLDNVPVSDIEELLKIEPKKLNAIEVFNTEYLLGDYYFEGIISLHSQTENFAGYKWNNNSVFLNYITLHPKNTFHHPVYKNHERLSEKNPDFRTLLYWNPKLQMKGEEEVLYFYSSDHQSEYEVLVRGYTNEGIPCYGRIDFVVMKEEK